MLASLQALAPDIVHSHGLWQWPSAVTASWSRRTKRPHVVSPHGMLDPWAWRNSRWKKRIAWSAYDGRNLRTAGCLHALCDSERASIRSFGLRAPIAVIPNGVTLPDDVDSTSSSPPKLVFLGRLHPKKGLTELLKGWSLVPRSKRSDWRLVIAGWDDGGHEPGLQRLAADLGIQADVDFVGPKFHAEKQQLLATAAGFILPSHSEGLPMSVLEAWSHRLPVLMTPHCNLPEGFATESALEISAEPSSITAGLLRFFEMSPAERVQIGTRGRKLVEERFAWSKVAQQMLAVYEWVLGGGTPPECVRTE
jgi:glycosyltransferase involved in cell wall biosynthesis